MSTTTPDRIRLSGLSARGYHGVLPFERTEGQLFTADVTLDLGKRGTAIASVTDEIKDAIDYSEVARAVIAVIEGEPVSLIETLAARVSEAVLGFPRVTAVEVTIHKPQAPLDVAFEDIAVTIHRTGGEGHDALSGRSPAQSAPEAAPGRDQWASQSPEAALGGIGAPAAMGVGMTAADDEGRGAGAAHPAAGVGMPCGQRESAHHHLRGDAQDELPGHLPAQDPQRPRAPLGHGSVHRLAPRGDAAGGAQGGLGPGELEETGVELLHGAGERLLGTLLPRGGQPQGAQNERPSADGGRGQDGADQQQTGPESAHEDDSAHQGAEEQEESGGRLDGPGGDEGAQTRDLGGGEGGGGPGHDGSRHALVDDPHHAYPQPQSHVGVDDVEAPRRRDEGDQDQEPGAGGGGVGAEEPVQDGQQGQDGGGLGRGRGGGEAGEGPEAGPASHHRAEVLQHAHHIATSRRSPPSAEVSGEPVAAHMAA